MKDDRCAGGDVAGQLALIAGVYPPADPPARIPRLPASPESRLLSGPGAAHWRDPRGTETTARSAYGRNPRASRPARRRPHTVTASAGGSDKRRSGRRETLDAA